MTNPDVNIASLPPRPPHATALGWIREHNVRTKAWIVVLDDDPTGSQSVHEATVLVNPKTEDLLEAARKQQLTFIWTNARSLPEDEAASINRAVVLSAVEAAGIAGVRPVFVSRSDSTLRGHFAAEISAILNACEEAGEHLDGVVFAPAFLEAGRFTADDVQWIAQPDGSAVPAAETEFAGDATFGYRETNLKQWILARTRLPPEKVKSIPLDGAQTPVDGVQTPGIRSAERILMSLRDGDIVIANAVTAADLETLVLACQRAERAGRRLIYRTGPSCVRALAGQPPRGPLTAVELRGRRGAGSGFGLTVVGSHTALTTRQIEQAVRRHRLSVVELDVDSVLDENRRESARLHVVESLERAVRVGHTALITSRSVRTAANDPDHSLAIARLISDEVCAVIAALPLEVPLRYLVAKGGITSHEVAVRGLGMRRATVLGQLFPGLVSVLRLGPETPRPDMPYVVFPGNVGDDASLADVLSTLAGVA